MTPEEIADQAAADALADAKATQEAEAAFASGFPTAESDTPTAVTPPVVQETAPLDAVQTSEVVAETPVPQEPPLATLTEAQLNDIVSKANSVGEVRAAIEKLRGDAFGKLGGLERLLKQLQESSSPGEIAELKPEDLEELRADGYVDLSANLVKGLNRALARAKKPVTVAPVAPAPAFDPSTLQPLMEDLRKQVKQEVTQETEARLLSRQHKDWAEVIGPKDSATPFRAWLKGKGTAYETQILSSWDSSEIADALDTFKTEAAARTKAVPRGQDSRSQRLAEAVPPRGGASAPPKPRAKTPEEEFADGFAGR
jgi:hypothetical protein